MRFYVDENEVTIEEFESELEDAIRNEGQEDSYDEMLNDCYGTIKIGECEYDASYVLYNVDRVAYDIGYNDYINSIYEDMIYEFENDEMERLVNGTKFRSEEED